MKMAWKWFVEKVNERTARWWLVGDDVLPHAHVRSSPRLWLYVVDTAFLTKAGLLLRVILFQIFRLKIYSHLVCSVGKLKDSFCAGLVNCSFGASGEDKREEVFIIWEEKRRDPFTAIMFQEVECWPHL